MAHRGSLMAIKEDVKSVYLALADSQHKKDSAGLAFLKQAGPADALRAQLWRDKDATAEAKKTAETLKSFHDAMMESQTMRGRKVSYDYLLKCKNYFWAIVRDLELYRP